MEPNEEESKGTKRKSLEDSGNNEGEKIQRTEDRADVGNKETSENDKENVINQVVVQVCLLRCV